MLMPLQEVLHVVVPEAWGAGSIELRGCCFGNMVDRTEPRGKITTKEPKTRRHHRGETGRQNNEHRGQARKVCPTLCERGVSGAEAADRSVSNQSENLFSNHSNEEEGLIGSACADAHEVSGTSVRSHTANRENNKLKKKKKSGVIQ